MTLKKHDDQNRKIELIEKKLWRAADQLRSNSELRSSEYSMPVLGLIFLRYADYKFTKALDRHGDSKLDIIAEGLIYLPEKARFKYLLELPEGANFGQAINDAMRLIEGENDDLKGVLPRGYTRIDNKILIELLKDFNSIQVNGDDGDVFGKFYEYFLGNFAMAEGQGGGEFFTPTPLVRLIVEIVEPSFGRIYDPACGSGGMFVQSAEFLKVHHKSASKVLSVYGQEKTAETVRLGKMNLAVHGLAGDIRQGNTYYEDIHDSVGKFDFVMANPPFNVDGVDKDRIKNDPRYPFGMPRSDNANYLWIQHFYSALNDEGRAGFVMANSACDARASELEIRKKIIQAGAVDIMVSIGSNMFYTVTLPCMLWFLDKYKKGSVRENMVLFIDARQIYKQVDRAHREMTPEQIEFIANIANLYRDEKPEFVNGSKELFEEYGMSIDKYHDVPGLCKVATLDEIKAQNYTLNPSRYIDIDKDNVEAVDFLSELNRLNKQLDSLNAEAATLEAAIHENVKRMMKK